MAAWTFAAAEFEGGLVPIELGHVAVHEDRLVGAAAAHLERHSAVCRDVHLEAVLLQHADGHDLVDLVVLGEEHQVPGPLRAAGG